MSAFGTIANLNALEMSIPNMPHEAEDVYEYVFSNIASSWAIMTAFVVVCYIASVFILKNVSKDSR